MATKKQKLPTTTEPATPVVEQKEAAATLPKCKDKTLNIQEGKQLRLVASLFKTGHNELITDSINKAVCGASIKSQDEAVDMVLMTFTELKPESYLETLLITQMMQVNIAAASCTQRAFAEGQSFEWKQLNANLAIKMHRTFLAQIEALQKLRGKGGQKVTVEHVTVNAGGQAIVGNVEHRQGGEG